MTLAAACILARTAYDAAELDATTLDGCRSGDPAALRIFVDRYQRRVFAYLSRTLGELLKSVESL